MEEPLGTGLTKKHSSSRLTFQILIERLRTNKENARHQEEETKEKLYKSLYPIMLATAKIYKDYHNFILHDLK